MLNGQKLGWSGHPSSQPDGFDAQSDTTRHNPASRQPSLGIFYLGSGRMGRYLGNVGLTAAPNAMSRSRNELADRNRTGRRAGLAILYCVLCLCVGGAFVAASLPRPAAAVDSEARQFILMDAGTGMTIAEKSSDEPMYPASMTKIMTLYVAFEHLADGRLTMEDTFTVSKKAWRMKGLRMFLEVNSKVTVGELLRGIAVQSGNDASIVIAEGLAGSEAAFADLMNETGAELGLDDSHFVNSTGWPDPDHITTARDVAELSRRIIVDFPEYYPLFAEKSYTYNGIKQGNRNPLLYRFDGADGLKTGYTEASGHGLAASAKRGEQRLVLVVNGLNGVDVRAREAERLLDYGFREFNPGESVFPVPAPVPFSPPSELPGPPPS